MKKLRKYSLYHVLSDRWNCKFRKQAVINFLSHICRDDNLNSAYFPIQFVTALIIAVYFNFTFWGFTGIFVLMHFSSSVFTAAVDTYNTYKYRIRQATIKSIYQMMEIEVDRFGKPIKRVK